MSLLKLDNISCVTYLGVPLEERSNPQRVVVDLEINFSSSLMGEKSDLIVDVIDYAKLIAVVQQFCLASSFSLLEKLTFALGEYLKKQINFPHRLKISLSKINPVLGLDRATYQITWDNS